MAKVRFDYHHGPIFIDENFVTCRGPGDAIPIHGGGHDHCKKMSYGYAQRPLLLRADKRVGRVDEDRAG